MIGGAGVKSGQSSKSQTNIRRTHCAQTIFVFWPQLYIYSDYVFLLIKKLSFIQYIEDRYPKSIYYMSSDKRKKTQVTVQCRHSCDIIILHRWLKTWCDAVRGVYCITPRVPEAARLTAAQTQNETLTCQYLGSILYPFCFESTRAVSLYVFMYTALGGCF